MNKHEIFRFIDHTLLKQNAVWEQIREICQEGMDFGTASVCIPPSFVKQAAEFVGERLPICTVIGFPNGYQTTAVKVFEAAEAVQNGAAEIDMVINIGWAKAKSYDAILQEINAVKDACGEKRLKVIIETCLLTEEEKIALCDVVSRSRAEFIKTSTGFAGGGATLADIRLFKKYVTGDTKIKAAGGIKSVADAEAFLAAGADRLGSSSLLAMLRQEIKQSGCGGKLRQLVKMGKRKREEFIMSLLKKFAAMAMVAVMAVGMTACGGGDDAADTKTYVIATDTTFAPFEFQNDAGEYVGVDMDLLAAIAEDQGFKYDLQYLGFDAAVQALESGQADGVIAGMSITPERQKKFDFSDPYFDSGVVMGIAESNNDIKSYEDLKGKKVAVKRGTEGYDFAESIKDQYGFETVVFDTSDAMCMDVKVGNSVACFEDYPVLGYGITQGNGLKMVTDKEQGSSYGFAVGKGENAELLKMFNTGLANLKENGKYQEILDTYIQE